MGAASTDRLVQGRRARKRKASWPTRMKKLKSDLMQDRALVWKQAHDKIAEARDAQDQAEADAQQLRRRLSAMYENGPAVLEIVQVKERGFFGRIWWALGFAFTRKLRWEKEATS